ncbi:MAG: hypothetical protein ACK5IN_03440 [Microbacterium sp.]|uniref:hypothetical protein n=1 Tax=Microbacterium sp. TaxID=51671 RepID=UPI003A890985
MPPTQTERFLYFAHRALSPAELSAARLDGHLVEVGEGYIPADAVETVALRAASLSPILGDQLAAIRLSAAWVHGVVDDPPVRHAAQRAVAHRITTIVDRCLEYRDGVVEGRDLLRIGGVLVTTRPRTLADLSRDLVLGDAAPAVVRAVDAMSADPTTTREAIVSLALHEGVPGRPKALDLLRERERCATTM